MAGNDKRKKVPSIDICHDDGDSGFEIRVDLAGAPKETIHLDMGERGFCIDAEAEDFIYDTCFMLGHEVKNKDAKAKFESGLLKIYVPFKDTLHGYKVAIA